MPLLKYRNGSGQWITVPDTSQLKYWDGDSWELPTIAKYWDGGKWVTFWANSDPVTYAFYADWTQSYIQGSHQTDENVDGAFSTIPDFLAVGHWGTTYQSINNQYWNSVTGLIGFKDSIDNNGSGLSLNSALATRPVIKSMSLRLTSENAYVTEIDFYVGSFFDGGNANSSWVHTHSSSAYPTKTEFTQTQYTTKTHTFTTSNNPTLYSNFANHKGIVLHGTDGNYDKRGYFTGRTTPAGNSERPLLTIQLDYT